VKSTKSINKLSICLLTIFLITLALSTVCAEEAKTLIVAFEHDATSMDPHDTMDATTFIVRDNIYDGLTRYVGSPVELVPNLAKSWDASSEAKVWTFYLNENVKFHDGSEMTAEDVVFSMEKILHGGKGIANTLRDYVEPGSTEAVDKYTVRFNLNDSYACFDGLAQFIYVLNKDVMLKHEEDGDYGNRWLATNGSHLGADGVGTGPYTLGEWQVGSYWTYERFDDYFQGWNQPHIKKARVEVIYEITTRIAGVKKGEFHLWPFMITYDNLTELMKSPKLQRVDFPNPKLEYIALNNTKPPTSDVHFRKALNYAFDYDMYIKDIGHNFSTRNIGYIPNTIFGSLDPDKEEFYYTYDIEKAREELAKVEIDYKQYEPLTIGVLQGYPTETSRAEVMMLGLQKLGIEAKVQLVTWPTWQETVSDPETAYHISPMGLSAYYFDPDHWSRLTDPRGHGTHMGAAWYNNPKVTELHKEALRTTDKEERVKLYQEAQRINLQDASHIWVHQLNYHNAVSKELGGVENFCAYGWLMDFRNIYFKSEWE